MLYEFRCLIFTLLVKTSQLFISFLKHLPFRVEKSSLLNKIHSMFAIKLSIGGSVPVVSKNLIVKAIFCFHLDPLCEKNRSNSYLMSRTLCLTNTI